jgi:single-strand DNA-binding protein
MLRLQVIGNLGKDATSNNVNGKTVINFSVAHTEKYKNQQGQQQDKTIWVECAYWTERTGILPYLKKGTQVYAEGTPDLRNYTTQDGRTGTSLQLRVSNVQLLGQKQEGGGDGQSYSAPQNQNYQPTPTPSYNQPAPTVSAGDMTEPLDDLPF